MRALLCSGVRASRRQPPTVAPQQGKGPYGKTFHFAGQYPLPTWMQHVIVVGAVLIGLALLPILIVMAVKNVAQGEAPLRTGALSRQIAAQREAADPAAQAKRQFLAEQSDRPVLDLSEYEQLATAELINAINHAGAAKRTQVVRTLALSRNTALRLLPWCNEKLRADTSNEHAEFIWVAAVELSGCDPAQIPRERLYWRAALGLEGATPLSPVQRAIWSCVLDAAAAEEASFQSRAAETQGSP